MQNKKILVTGGAGFIGSNICNELQKTNTVYSLDNYLTGNPNNHVDGVTYINGCVSNIKEIFCNEKFDNILHFGEYSRVELSLKEPGLALENGYRSFPKILEYALETSAKITYSASSTKFANNGSKLSPYTFFKTSNSELIQRYGEWYGLDYVNVYFYNCYGENEISQGNYATLIGKYTYLKRNNPSTLPVSKPGFQTRNFTHVEDTVAGIILATELGDGDGYGIGSDEAYSIAEVCEMFGCFPDYYEANSANRLKAPVNNEKIKALGWRPRHSLPNYIARLYKTT